jgi:hypothetical protein
LSVPITMKLLQTFLITTIIACAVGCTRPANGSQESTADPKRAQPGHGSLNFAPYTKEDQKAISDLKEGEWIPVTIPRAYIILREHGIKVDRGDYFVSLLLDSQNKYPRFVLAKHKGVKTSDIDLKTGKASDGSFAEVLNFVAHVTFGHNFDLTQAFVSGSGESAGVWVHQAGEREELRGELFGLENYR